MADPVEGPPGDHVAGLDDAGRRALRRRCAERLGPPPFEVRATAGAAVGTVSRRGA